MKELRITLISIIIFIMKYEYYYVNFNLYALLILGMNEKCNLHRKCALSWSLLYNHTLIKNYWLLNTSRFSLTTYNMYIIVQLKWVDA